MVKDLLDNPKLCEIGDEVIKLNGLELEQHYRITISNLPSQTLFFDIAIKHDPKKNKAETIPINFLFLIKIFDINPKSISSELTVISDFWFLLSFISIILI